MHMYIGWIMSRVWLVIKHSKSPVRTDIQVNFCCIHMHVHNPSSNHLTVYHNMYGVLLVSEVNPPSCDNGLIEKISVCM